MSPDPGSDPDCISDPAESKKAELKQEADGECLGAPPGGAAEVSPGMLRFLFHTLRLSRFSTVDLLFSKCSETLRDRQRPSGTHRALRSRHNTGSWFRFLSERFKSQHKPDSYLKTRTRLLENPHLSELFLLLNPPL